MRAIFGALLLLGPLAGVAQAACPNQCTVTGSSTTMFVIPSGTVFLSIDNESAAAVIACNFGGTAALNTAGSYTIPFGTTRTWSKVEGARLGGPLNCISGTGPSPATMDVR